MIKSILKICVFLFNTAVFFTLTVIIFKVVWHYIGIDYIFGKTPIGGDYFNSLTYQIHFSKYLPNPPTGWLPFWNGGMPVIGGYPFLSFYITHLLTSLYNLPTAVNIFSIGSLILFFISSLLLFWQVSKNWLFAISAVAALFATRATYYQLTAGGFIVSASAQWYLPIVLFFIYKSNQSQNWRHLVLASIFSGLSILHHSATSLLMIFTPAFLILMLMQKSEKKLKKRIVYLALFTAVSVFIGSIGIYATYLQNFLGAGTDACASEQCWGIYPKHLVAWLTPLSPVLALVAILLALITKIFKRRTNLFFMVPAAAGLAVFLLYAAAAHFKLINGIANVIPPTRTFWAANFFVLLLAASAFGLIQKALMWLAYPLSILAVGITLFFVYNHQPDIYKERPNTVPYDAASFTIAPYQTKDTSQIVPIWVSRDDFNWRVDVLNQGVTQWWNVVAAAPQVRGYSNNPLGIHRDWQYFLQSATRDVPEDSDPELVQNRALFLLDAFGIQFIENSLGVYPQSITENPQFIKNKDIDFYVSTTRLFKNLQWYQLSPEITTPIIWPNSTTPVFFIGDDKGYENFIRSIAMTNLNSRILIPVHGPKSPNKITSEELKTFKIIVLYQYDGSSLDKLTGYVKKGGKVFIDTGSIKFKRGKLADIIPFETLESKDISGAPYWEMKNDEIASGLDIQKFSALSFDGGPWRTTTNKMERLRPWARNFINYQNQPAVAGGQLGNGYVIWSGLNLPFHIVDNNNLEEAKLFKNILFKLLEPKNTPGGNFRIARPKPEFISVEGENYNGIYFKENYDSGWKAKVNNKTTKIYKAGLEFMYIVTTPANNSKVTTTIEYKGSVFTWGIFALTLFALLISVILIILPAKFLSFVQKTISKPVNKIGEAAFGLSEDDL